MSANQQVNGRPDPDMFDVRGSLASLIAATREHKLLVVMTCALTLLAATLYVVFFPPIFVTTARVLVEKPIDISRDTFYNTFDVFRKDDPRTEMELMRSAPLLAEVIKREGLKYADVYHPMTSELSELWKKSGPGRAYEKLKQAIHPSKPDPDAPPAGEIEIAKTVSDMIEGVRVMPVNDSNLAELTLKGPSRRVGSTANALLDLYLERRAERYQNEAQRNLDALDKEVASAAVKAQEVGDRRRDFLTANHLSFDLLKESQQLTKMVDLEDNIETNRAKRASLEGSLDLVEGQLALEPMTRTTATTVELNAVRESAKAKRLELEAGLISLRAVYREDSPEVQEVLHNITELDRVIEREPEKIEKTVASALNSTRQELVLSRNTLRSQIEGITNGLKAMEETDARWRARMAAVPDLATRIKELDRQFALANDNYLALSGKRAQAAVSRAMAGAGAPSMIVVQRATNPDTPGWPKLKILYPSALMVGLILGVAGAQIRNLTNGRVSRNGLKRALPDSPVYGTIRIPIGTRPFTVASSRRVKGSAGNES